MIGIYSDADRYRDRDPQARRPVRAPREDRELRLPDGRTDPSRHGRAALGIGLREQYDELLAPLPEDEVDLPYDRTDPPGELGQHRVAGPVPEPVVHLLEPVQVEGQHAE